MADQVTIDKKLFHDRLSAFLAAWKTDRRSGDGIFQGVGSIVICVGKASEGEYPKSSAFQLWLFGYEFPTSLFIITPETLHVVMTKKKATYIQPLKDGKVPIEIELCNKDPLQNGTQLKKCLDIIKAAGKKVGVLSKENPAGPFAQEWSKVFGGISKELDLVEISNVFSAAALAVKDERELRAIRDASRASSGLLKEFFVEEMSGILDEEKKITHAQLADKVNAKIEEPQFFKQLKVAAGFDPTALDWATMPVVQSGGSYTLKFDTPSDNSSLHAGVIVCALGLRYQSYASLVARTYMVDPNKEQEENYAFLLEVQKLVFKNLRGDVLAKDVYNKALSYVASKKPHLKDHFLKSIGAGIGVENQDPNLVLNSKNTRPLKDGMTLTIVVGFQGLENKKAKNQRGKVYSLILADTVRVTGGEPAVFTKDAPADLETIAFFFNDSEQEEEAPKPKAKKDAKIGAVAQKNITATRLRNERAANQDAEKEAARREHQKELHAKKQEQGLEKYVKGTGNLNGTEERKFKRFESYKRDSQLPPRVKDNIVVVDSKSFTVVVPIMGRAVPFHINTIKNANLTPEGEFTSLRINFLSPGQGVGRKEDHPFEDPNAHFVRSLTFRSQDTDRMQAIVQQITELKKDVVRRETEKKQMADVVEQDKLIIDRRPARLESVFLRPSIDSKRVSGEVQIHQNGLTYSHGMGNASIDILFNNIRHLFFQPCKSELIVLIHIHLINPIMIGKRKTTDIQFMREATDMQFDETGNRKRKQRYGDDEEFQAEQEERRRRAELDKQFLNFAKKIEDAGRDTIRVDIPFRDLGFNGVPARSSVWISPTTDCLVQLTEPPFLVITLYDIEIVHLERVQFGLKNFDMVVVFKDFTRAPQHINTIPVESLDAVKDWLDSVEIPFTEGPLNLQWPTIMKTVQADPHTFFVEGGWSFLGANSDSEDEEQSSEESAFELSDEEVVSDESESEASDFDEDASAEETDPDASEDDDTEGEDWDELEKNAKKADRARPEQEEPAPRKRKR
ncbi:SPT16-domain-containing protein [Trichodelitschia bisporula]|uniref:FACT complex subunit n=1 Tax=Trichodelitschia bisporula TaxID=703511 RepID=A0A6G1HMS1_9PEZI|nr:SPT16-domain-containing protein [Trichodelitschia bisporula]